MKNKKLIKPIEDIYAINGLNYYCACVYDDYVEPDGRITRIDWYHISCDDLYAFDNMDKNYIYMYTKKKITRDTLTPYI